MKYKDYYEILSVPRSASQQEIKSAYRKLAKNIIRMLTNLLMLKLSLKI